MARQATEGNGSRLYDGEPGELLQVDMPPRLKRWLREVAHQRKQAGYSTLTTMQDITTALIDRLMFSAWEIGNSDVTIDEVARENFSRLVEEISYVAHSISPELYGPRGGSRDTQPSQNTGSSAQH